MGLIRAVLFDFGGVLIRMVDDRPRQKLASQLEVSVAYLDNLVFYSPSAQRASRGEITVGMHWEAVRSALGITVDDMGNFLDQYWSADDVDWQLLDFIKKLHPRFKVGLLSNAWDDLRQTMHNRWNIDGLFDDLVISAEVKLVKPDPRIFHLSLDRLGVQPEETAFVDDMPDNVIAAQREGIHAIHFSDTQQTIDELSQLLSLDKREG